MIPLARDDETTRYAVIVAIAVEKKRAQTVDYCAAFARQRTMMTVGQQCGARVLNLDVRKFKAIVLNRGNMLM
jgi:hypothetical protein